MSLYPQPYNEFCSTSVFRKYPSFNTHQSKQSLTYYTDLYFPYLNIVSIYDVKIIHWIMA